MNEPLAAVRAYLSSPDSSFWQWGPEGETVYWSLGGELAPAGEVNAVMERLCDGGLPPLGALLMLLAACQPGWSAEGGGRERLAEYVREHLRRDRLKLWGQTDKETSDNVLGLIAARIDRAIPALDRVAALPRELLSGSAAQCALAEFVFEICTRRISPGASHEVLQELARLTNPAEMTPHFRVQDDIRDFLQYLDALLPGLEGLTEERLRTRTKTGLDGPVGPAELTLPKADQIRGLLRRLSTDKELAGLSRLARNLMAAIHIPRKLWSEDELPLGGYSDLTHRGPLDRLLISELAHDNLTLAVRVALNEALYLRRESPPRSPPEKRHLLIDSGIRLWGLPRVYATAAALALAALTDRQSDCAAHRTSETSLNPVDLFTREGVMEHLSALGTAPHPGSSMPSFLQTAAGGDEPAEAILITHSDVPEDPDFRKQMEQLSKLDLFIATVNGAGAFHLFHQSQTGRRTISRAQLSLETILSERVIRPDRVALSLKEIDPEMPSLISQEPFPLLLTKPVSLTLARQRPSRGVVAVTGDGRLLHWSRESRGARQLSALIPRGKVHGLFMESDGKIHIPVGILPGNRVPLIAAHVDPSRKVLRSELQTSGQIPVGACRITGALCLIFRDRIDAFDPETAETLSTLTVMPAGTRWNRDRFFQAGSAGYALEFDGKALRLQRLPLPHPRIVALFDREEMDGPFALTAAGNVHAIRSGEPLPLSLDFVDAFTLIGISQDGHRLGLRTRPEGRRRDYLLDLQTRDVRDISGDPWLSIEPELRTCSRSNGNWTLFHSFRGIFTDPRGQLVLQTRSDRLLAVRVDPGGETLLVRVAEGLSAGETPIPFERIPSPGGARFTLRVARWPDGSRAYLDSRGLLHLISSRESTPEISLVLSNGELAGWTSDGQLFGPRFFTGISPTASPERVQGVLSSFIREVRR